jgi:alpha-L-fucosidase
MTKNPRLLIVATAALASLTAAAPAADESTAKLNLPIASGPFKPTDESLKQYQYPDWFRDAKFGMWAHWGPQAVPRHGDWYAKLLYMEGESDYKDHAERYGPPSKSGYKDIIPLWKAEKWKPDELMALYKKAGAKYFVSMGTHHDNFFLWNSKIHRWNAVQMGPKKDVVGIWQKAAQKQGLRFGVSEHLGASFTWFQTSHGADKTGPLAGVPYDGNDPQYQDLYHPKAAPDDTGWLSNNPAWHQEWYNSIQELVNNYHPDLLYSDSGLPFGDVGRSMIAHFYNENMTAHGGKLEAVYNCKENSQGRWVQDLERGVMEGINPHPWQTDTSIGDWFYNSGQNYKSGTEIIQMLVDIVSKNGNLLINIVQTPEGDLEPDMLKTLAELSTWISVNGEAIYGTRPFHIYGEGSAQVVGGGFGEDKNKFGVQDIRFTTKGNILYAFCLGIPKGDITITSLAKGTPQADGEIRDVRLLGYDGKLLWKQTDKGLVITMPDKFTGEHAVAFRITGLKNIAWDGTVTSDPDGSLQLKAGLATLHGERIATEIIKDKQVVGYWDKSGEWVGWDKVRFPKAGVYEISMNTAAAVGETAFVIAVGDQQISGKAPATESWSDYKTHTVGRVTVKTPGTYAVSVKPEDPGAWKAMGLERVVIKPVAQ